MARRGTSGLNLIIGVVKPVGMSSHDVVDRVRRCLGERRVGHAGTLDPLASGVMVVGVGQATRLLGLISSEEKRYLARIAFGRETTTDDSEGETRRSAPEPENVLDLGFAQESMSLLRDMRTQVPPVFSAISVDGKRAYKAARQGEEIELAARDIHVFDARAVGVSRDDETGEPCWDVVVDVSKGTYVRALARDLGRALGSACYLRALRRLSSGSVSIGDCVELEDLASGGATLALERALDPVSVMGLERVEVVDRHIDDVRCGRSFSIAGIRRSREGDDVLALVHGGRLLALARAEGPRIVPQSVFVEGIVGVLDGEKA